MRTGITLTLLGIGAALSLAFAPTVDGPIRLEHDPDQRAICVGQLLDAEQLDYTAVNVLTTLDYTDRFHGGPCAALDHYRTHGWY